jgi:hypothetical protein
MRQDWADEEYRRKSSVAGVGSRQDSATKSEMSVDILDRKFQPKSECI